VTEHLEVIGVEGDSVMLLVLKAEDLGGNVFDSREEARRTGKDEGDVGPERSTQISAVEE
jgi:hypothetical protein